MVPGLHPVVFRSRIRCRGVVHIPRPQRISILFQSERKLVTQLLQYVASGIAVGSLYGLVALGIVLVYKATRVFNFAHGEFVALSAYLLTTLTAATGSMQSLAVVAVLVISTSLGVLFHLLVVRRMMDKPLLATVMATIGLGLAIRALIAICYGPNPIQQKSFITDDVLELAGVRIAMADIVVTGVAIVLLCAFALFFLKSRMGLEMRAVASHLEAAALSGVNTGRAFAVALGVGALLAGVAGVLLANTTVVSPGLTGLALIAFPAVIIGGITSVQGAIVGGLLVGIMEKIAGGYINAQAAIAIVYLVLLAVLLIRPQGLFGTKEVVRA
ncbi:branched-chain amino acid ABC transporter permease [Rhodococcus sp. WS4]|nr:branched-chain amino acid ABC transporter permease [Rhodococcus sp. WS4]